MTLRYLSFGLLFLSGAATAGGFQSGPQSARTMGLGGAGTAYIRDLAVIYYNPGALSQLDSLTHVSIGGLGTARVTSFLGTDSHQVTNKGVQPVPGGYFYASHRLNKKIAVGLSVNTPFGYDTRWPSNWEGRSVVLQARLNTVFIQPTIAYNINENFSAGAGFVYAYGRMRQQYALSQYDNRDAVAHYGGSGSGAGFNVGLYGRTGDNLAFGISYRSGLTLHVKNGTATYSGVPDIDADRYPASSKLRTDIKLPGVLSVGLADHMTKKLLVTFDFALTGWSRYDSLAFNVDKGASLAARTAGKHYEDAMAFRVGGEYSHSELLTFRAGLSYDETPIRDEYISPDLPDGNRVGASLGVGVKLNNRLSADAGYQFEYAAQRTSRVIQAKSNIYNVGGTYRTFVHTAALGLSYSF